MINNMNSSPRPDSSVLQATVIADVISAPDAIVEARRFVSSNMFSGKAREAWEALCKMWDSGDSISINTVYATVDNAYLTQKLFPLYSTRTGSGSEVVGDAMALAQVYARQVAFDGATELIRLACGTPEQHELSAMIDRIKDKIYGNTVESRIVSLADAINLLGDELEGLANGTVKHVPTSLQTLDTILCGGFAPGSLVIIAARPSVGKSALMLQFSETAAISGFPAVIYSMEMPASDLAKRLIFSTGEISSLDLSQERIKVFDWERFDNASRSLSDLPITINDFDNNVERICSEITDLHQKGQCEIAFVDYLGLTERLDPKDTLANDLGARTRKFKNLAMRLRIPIVVLCQMNRQGDACEEPQLVHLRDSGAIEQDADVIAFITRSPTPNEIKLWIKKNRNGKVDICIPLAVNNCYAAFKENCTVSV